MSSGVHRWAPSELAGHWKIPPLDSGSLKEAGSESDGGVGAFRDGEATAADSKHASQARSRHTTNDHEDAAVDAQESVSASVDAYDWHGRALGA